MFSFEYELSSNKHRGRVGKLMTPHGVIETPAFIFCGTKASVKGVLPEDLRKAGTQIVLSNTYHMMLQPGGYVVKSLGGLHKMMGWDGPMLTDSGGYQIFSLGHGSVSDEIKGRRAESQVRNKSLLKIDENGAVFRSYIDGSIQILTPERSMRIQQDLGADLVVVLDECTPFHVSKEYTGRSMQMSHRWAVRSLREFQRITQGEQRLYGIIQGGVYEDLRRESVDFVNNNNFFGHAIGGSLGADKEQMYDVVRYTAGLLRESRPIHLLGIGGVRDIFEGVKSGIDTFDCVHPTRIARHGGALVKASVSEGKEHINLKSARYKTDASPIEEDCSCYTCSHFSKGAIQHLIRSNEMVGLTLITIHNVHFMNALMLEIRSGLKQDSLDSVARKWACC